MSPLKNLVVLWILPVQVSCWNLEGLVLFCILAVLTNSINLRNEALNFNYNQLTNENLDFSKIKGVGDFASGLKDSGSKKDSSIKSEPEEFKFINCRR